MIWLLVVCLFATSLFSAACAVFSALKHSRNPMERPLRYVLISVSAAVAVNAVSILMPSARPAYFVYGLYCILMDIMVLALLHYAKAFTGEEELVRKARNVFMFAVGADALLMLINPFLKIVFRMGVYEDGFGEHFYHVASRGILYIYHILVIYAMMFVVNLALFKKIRSAPRLYKIKHGAILVAMCIIMIIHAIYLNFKLQFDYSLLFYSALALIMVFFTLLYVPHGLMDRLLFFTMSNMKDGIVCIDNEGRVVHANRTVKDYSEADIDIGSLDNQLQKWFTEDITQDCTERTWDTVRRIEGRDHYYHIDFMRIYDGDVKYLGCFFLVHDRTEEYVRYYTEKYRATHDMLTGIYNKEHFFERTKAMLDENPDIHYVIVCTDVKNFKLVNDVFGVEAGDRMLRKIAEITASFGGDDVVYGRLSGDRFAMCMPKYSFNEREILSKYSVVDSFLENASFKTHIHIGVYEVTDRSLRIPIMCDRASLAIKTIKDSYQNSVAYYDSEIRKHFMSEQKVISEFESAIANGQFQPYIQPQISVGGRVCGGEALVRWIHPHEGLIPPSKFIPIFEQTGLISRLDKLMWELACRQLSIWKMEGREESYLSVNISPKDFYMLDVCGTMTSLIEKYNIPPHCLHLEITESAVMDEPQQQLRLIGNLREAGFMVEIDDFGSGYSSLNMLKELDADVLKIDMGFLEKTDHPERSQTILKMIIGLAKSLEMEVITEGVETKEQAKFLAEYGCDLYQGYFFAKPMRVSEFENKYLNAQFIIR
ncbi:MAG: EAL domain-containing protein [Ruminococcus sp.]|nr:EAL domain-containing protein [Ruminococcus sp.]